MQIYNSSLLFSHAFSKKIIIHKIYSQNIITKYRLKLTLYLLNPLAPIAINQSVYKHTLITITTTNGGVGGNYRPIKDSDPSPAPDPMYRRRFRTHSMEETGGIFFGADESCPSPLLDPLYISPLPIQKHFEKNFKEKKYSHAGRIQSTWSSENPIDIMQRKFSLN